MTGIKSDWKKASANVEDGKVESGISIDSMTGRVALLEGTWQDFDGIRVGFNIVEVDGSGKIKGIARITNIDDIFSTVIPVVIVAPFTSESLSNEEWRFEVPDFHVSRNHLPSVFSESDASDKTWIVQFMEHAEDLLLKEINDASNRLELRNPDTSGDSEYFVEDGGGTTQLELLLETLGSFIPPSKLSREEKVRLAKDLGYFYEISGTKGYLFFLSYIFNVPLRPERLWTKDYKTFITEEVKDDQADIGNYYLTNRIRILHDFENSPGAVTIDSDDVEELFYRTAPVQDILDRFAILSKASLERDERIVEIKEALMSAHYVGEGGY